MQSEIDSLREINLKLLAEIITELKKENAEVKAENIEVKAENAKLKHALEEHEARFMNLEQRDKEKTILIAKLDDDIREIKQEQNAINISAEKKNIEKLYLKKEDNQNTLLHQKILYRQKVEQDSNGMVFDIQISKFSLEAILTGSSNITAQTIVDLFNVTMKVRQKKILC
ncbi:hypothetical protein C1645_753829, partial [Glomus cerebriforme]